MNGEKAGYYTREQVREIFDREKLLLIGQHDETTEAVPREIAVRQFGEWATGTTEKEIGPTWGRVHGVAWTKPKNEAKSPCWGVMMKYFTLEGLERAAAWYNLQQIENNTAMKGAQP